MEETVVRVLDCVPRCPGWKWLPDCNIVAVSSHLSEAERDKALADLSVNWRRSMIRVVV